jgi:hypothetical protein
MRTMFRLLLVKGRGSLKNQFFRLDSIESNQGAPSPTHAGTPFPCCFDYLFDKI